MAYELMKRIFGFVFAGFVMFPGVLFSQLSPGDLHKAHAELEGLKNCTQCHGSGQQISSAKCLDCHKFLKDRIDRQTGLHANSEYRECQKCHVEHHGRDFDLIWWKNGKDNFDHSKTGYELRGAHSKLKCNQCHRPKNISNKEALQEFGKDLDKTYLGLKIECTNCHQDEHRGQFKKDCLQCHNMNEWKPAPGFDHNETKFSLTGKHRNVQCEKCHKPVTDHKFPDNPTYLKFSGVNGERCLNCHTDVHRNKFGKNCETCHTTSGWKNYNRRRFSHDDTRFPLKGEHAKLVCETCHRPGQPLRGLKFGRCVDCHSDYHRGQFTNRDDRFKCESCHTVQGFIPARFTIEQHNKTEFPLKGAHLAVPCIACHKKVRTTNGRTTTQFRFALNSCKDCHSDPHKGSADKFISVNGCQHCHTADSWKKMSYDHSKTDFPLTGRHSQTDCIKCHGTDEKPSSSVRLKLTAVSQQCEDCHQDPHMGQFARSDGRIAGTIDCARCHSPQDWFAEKFDHNRDARFKLEGAHRFVKCGKCHPNQTLQEKSFVLYKPLDTACRACHGGQLLPERNKP